MCIYSRWDRPTSYYMQTQTRSRLGDNAHWAFIFTVTYGSLQSPWLSAQMCVCISVELWHTLRLCMCVCVIELWHCAISLTSTQSHSSQLNHRNSLLGQNAAVAVSVCEPVCIHMPLCVCVHRNAPNEQYIVCVRGCTRVYTVSKIKSCCFWWISDKFYLCQEKIFPKVMQL